MRRFDLLLILANISISFVIYILWFSFALFILCSSSSSTELCSQLQQLSALRNPLERPYSLFIYFYFYLFMQVSSRWLGFLWHGSKQLSALLCVLIFCLFVFVLDGPATLGSHHLFGTRQARRFLYRTKEEIHNIWEAVLVLGVYDSISVWFQSLESVGFTLTN